LNRKKRSATGNDNRNTFEELFNTYYPALCSFAHTYLNDKNLAEDIVQEVFLKMLNSRSELDLVLSIKSFLYTSVKNKCLNQLKHTRVIGKHAEMESSVKESEVYFVDRVIEEETHRLIYNAIDKLPPRCKEIVLLSLNGLKNNDIAKELKVSVNTVKTQKAIAYKQLRIKLKHLFALTPLFLQHFFN